VAAEITRDAASARDLDELLKRASNLILNRFDFYHIGIFLLDNNKEYAVLVASPTEAGREMMANNHRLRVGEVGIVGRVSATGEPRIALDTGADIAFFNNPYLPNTHSEMALPLKVENNIIGVLDVQSTEANAFQPEDTEVLYTLADQVAIAIQNARFHEATQKSLEEAQRTSVSYLKEAWRLLQTHEKKIGYLVSDNAIRPLEKFVSTPNVNQAVSQGEVVVEGGDAATLAVPIHLRGEVVGVLDIHVPAGHDWDPDEIDIARAVADRLSLALESATLLRSTQRRAEIERLTADISGKISSSINLRNVLQTAVEELGQVLPGSEVVIQFQTEQGRKKEVQ